MEAHLDGGGLLPAHLEDAHEQLPLQTVILELVALGGRDVLQQRQQLVPEDRDILT